MSEETVPVITSLPEAAPEKPKRSFNWKKIITRVAIGITAGVALVVVSTQAKKFGGGSPQQPSFEASPVEIPAPVEI